MKPLPLTISFAEHSGLFEFEKWEFKCFASQDSLRLSDTIQNNLYNRWLMPCNKELDSREIFIHNESSQTLEEVA